MRIYTLILIVCLFVCKPVMADEYYSISSGGLTGTYYVVGNSLAKEIKSQLNLKIGNSSSGGSIYNINMIEVNDTDIALCQANTFLWGKEGTTLFKEPKDNLYYIAALYPESLQLVVKEGQGIHDITGKRVVVGSIGSTTSFDVKVIQKELMIGDIHEQYSNFTDAILQFKNRFVDGAFIVAGTPSHVITSILTENKDLDLYSFSDEEIDTLTKIPYFSKDVISKDVYDGLIDNDINTISIMSVLAVSGDVSDDVVYDITKLLWETNFSKYHTIFEKMDINKATYLPQEYLHPGAKRYYDEVLNDK